MTAPMTYAEWQHRWWQARQVYTEERAPQAPQWRDLPREEKNRWYQVAIELERSQS